MSKKILVKWIPLVLVLLSCSSAKIEYDYKPSADFEPYQTYRWGDMDLSDEAVAADTAVGHFLRTTIDKVLTGKGYFPKDFGKSDFAVVVQVAEKNELEVEDWDQSEWYRPWWGTLGDDVEVSFIPEGALVIDLVDVSERELWWRGIATGIKWKSETVRTEIEESVAELLAYFPPPTDR